MNVVTETEAETLPLLSKDETADRILDKIQTLRKDESE